MADFFGSNGPDSLSGGEEGDFLLGAGGDDTLSGGGGNDQLTDGAGNDLLFGGAGNDFLTNRGGDDYISGGGGIDRVSNFNNSFGVTVNLLIRGPQATGFGNDTFVGIEQIGGTPQADTLTGDAQDNFLAGNGATAGTTDALDGGDGDDLLTIGVGDATLTGGSGTDTVGSFNPGDLPNGLRLSLALQGTVQAGGDGQLLLSGVENLTGSGFGDALTGDSGANVLAGAAGSDTLTGGEGADRLLGDGQIRADLGPTQQGGPVLTFADGSTNPDDAEVEDDVLDGGEGDDTLQGGAGNDTLTGGEGDDTAVFKTETDGADSTDLGNGADVVLVTAPGQVRLTFTSVEVGNGAALDGGTGANQDGGLAVRLQAEDAGDVPAGATTRFDDEGITFIAAGPGVTFDVRDLTSGVARGDQFEVVTLGTAAGDSLAAVERGRAYYINGGGGGDTVEGGFVDDFLVGGGGDDFLSGNAGADGLLGGAGADRLTGGAGADTLTGGAGRDTLNGGGDRDVDVFVFLAAGDSTTARTGQDVVNSFVSGIDKLDLRALAIADFDAQIRVVVRGEKAIVAVDLDGDGGFDDFGVQVNGATPVEGDFLL